MSEIKLIVHEQNIAKRYEEALEKVRELNKEEWSKKAIEDIIKQALEPEQEKKIMGCLTCNGTGDNLSDPFGEGKCVTCHGTGKQNKKCEHFYSFMKESDLTTVYKCRKCGDVEYKAKKEMDLDKILELITHRDERDAVKEALQKYYGVRKYGERTTGRNR